MNYKAAMIVMGCLMHWGATRSEAVKEVDRLCKECPDIKDIFFWPGMLEYRDDLCFGYEGNEELTLTKI
jgi:hypothetical protein